MKRRTLPILARSAGALLCALALESWYVPAGAQPPAAATPLDLGVAREIAPGVRLHHLTTRDLIEPPAPLSVWLLRVEPAAAELRPALANDEIMGTETVASIASRYGALAAVNAGFFQPNGDPSGVYKLGGQLISDTRRSRGAIGILRRGGSQRLIFDRVSATVVLRMHGRGRAGAATADIAGVDTTRQLGRLMLFTPAYHGHTDTAPGGSEWVLDGSPLRVVSGPHTRGKTRIPKSGFVLSYGGRSPPTPLRRLRRGARVELQTRYAAAHGNGPDWMQADHIIGGAGLLARDGRFVDDWAEEAFAKGFAETRHPRTMIGTHPDGSIWLVTVDGRQPDVSAGMTLVELRQLAGRLGLREALNLDGGGSTTMWAGGAVVNSPSDAAGPRKVSDALLVVSR